jgi:hypothetical protein
MGKELITLRDAALHITKLSKAEHDAAEWQAAMEALMLVVVRADRRDASVKPASRCTTRHARITIGDAANWCGIDDSG